MAYCNSFLHVTQHIYVKHYLYRHTVSPENSETACLLAWGY